MDGWIERESQKKSSDSKIINKNVSMDTTSTTTTETFYHSHENQPIIHMCKMLSILYNSRNKCVYFNFVFFCQKRITENINRFVIESKNIVGVCVYWCFCCCCHSKHQQNQIRELLYSHANYKSTFSSVEHNGGF